ncbi:hypothetical protein COP2_044329 [Malus domestica]
MIRCLAPANHSKINCLTLQHETKSRLTRIQNNGADAVYRENTINSFLDDYKPVEGIMIAHSGHSVIKQFRFGETAMSHTKTRMEEAWTVEEVAFKVRGSSMDCFIPPAELRFVTVDVYKDNCNGLTDIKGRYGKIGAEFVQKFCIGSM